MSRKKETVSISVFANEEHPLVIRLFGPFDVQVNGQPLARLRSQKGQWLMALLIMRHGQRVERSWLTGVFWPDSSERQALANLRLSLTDLRKALGGEAYRLSSPDVHSLCFDVEGANVDVVAFDAAVSSGDPVDLQHAITFYRGP